MDGEAVLLQSQWQPIAPIVNDSYFGHSCYRNCNKVYLFVDTMSAGEEESECMRMLGGSRDREVRAHP